MTRRILTHEQEQKFVHWIRHGDMTQQQAAQRAGVTESTISSMMKRYHNLTLLQAGIENGTVMLVTMVDGKLDGMKIKNVVVDDAR